MLKDDFFSPMKNLTQFDFIPEHATLSLGADFQVTLKMLPTKQKERLLSVTHSCWTVGVIWL